MLGLAGPRHRTAVLSAATGVLVASAVWAQIGSVTADEVNAVAAWLAQPTRDRRLPQKLLLLHQFQTRMISNRGTVDTSHDELAVLVHADGFGTPGQKFDTWRALRSEPLANAWWAGSTSSTRTSPRSPRRRRSPSSRPRGSSPISDPRRGERPRTAPAAPGRDVSASGR